MKKIFNKYFMAAMILMATACDVTDLKPVNVLSEEAAFSSAANVELSVVGLYDAAQSGFYAGSETNDRGYIFGAAHIQQGDMRGEDFVLINVFYDLTYRSTLNATSANNVNYWENAFRIINIANLTIEGVQGAIDAGVVTEAAGLAYQGEARLLRAATYHTLLVHFARPYLDGNGSNPGMPIYTAGVNSSAEADAVVETHRSTVAQTYDFILEDLTFAENNLPEARDGNKKVTRATKGAAIALKTRVYLHKGEWTNVITEGNKLVSAASPATSPIGGYALGASVETPWANNVSTESIMSMEMSAVDNTSTNSALARMLGSPTPAPGDAARGEYAISPIIWNQTFWDAADLRRTLLVHTYAGKRYTHKYRDYTNWTDFAPLIRYAEVILNVAEAESRQAALSPRALALLNQIRDRAKSGAMTSYTIANFATGVDLTRAILNERRVELLAEGHRWSDIHRNAVDANFKISGIPAKMNVTDATAAAYAIGTTPVTAVAAIPYTDFRYLWPIPQSETTRNPTLFAEQNPGW